MSARHRLGSPVFVALLVSSAFAVTSGAEVECLDHAELSPSVATVLDGQRVSDVVTIGDRLFAVSTIDHTVVELDISDPEAPISLGIVATTPGLIRFTELIGGALVLSGPTAGQGYLMVIDVSVPGAPVEIADEPLAQGAVDGLAVEGDRLWITVNGQIERLAVDGSGVTSLGTFTAPDHPLRLAGAGNRVWTASNTHLRLISFDDPANPVEVVGVEHASLRSGERGESTTPRALLQVGSYLILGRNDATLILDVSDLLDIHEIGSIGLATYEIAFVGDLFLRHRNSVVRYDVSTPSSPSPLAAYDAGVAQGGISVDGDRLLVAASGEGVDVIGLDHPFLDPVDVVEVSTLSRSFLDGSLLYALGGAGSPILDVSDPSAITEVGTVPFDADVLVTDGTYWYARRPSYVVSVHDWDGAGSSTLLGTWTEPGHWEVTDLWPGGDGLLYALVSEHADFETWPWIYVLDVSDPTSIEVLETVSVGGVHATDLVRAHGRLWVKSSETLSVFDITDPVRPVQTVSVATGAQYDEFPVIDRGGNIVFDGSLAYVADGAGGVAIFDVSVPDAPVRVGGSVGLSRIDRVAVAEGIVYAKTYPPDSPGSGGEIEVLDVQTPTVPVHLASFRLLGPVRELFAVGDHLLAAGGLDVASITVLPAQCAVSVDVADGGVTPARPTLAHPNPFRTRTSIGVDVSAAGIAELTVFDVSGRAVHRSALEVTPGNARVDWDGTDALGRPAPAGVYFLQVTAPGHESRSRVVRVAP